MPRPRCCRHVSTSPSVCVFKPAGVRACDLEEVALTLDQFEALRLADLEGLYHENAAQQMGVSRATFGRTVEAARRRVAEALVHGKALRIEGGPVCSGMEASEGAPTPSDARPRCPRCRREPSRRGQANEDTSPSS